MTVPEYPNDNSSTFISSNRMPHKIAILTHARQPFDSVHYLLHPLIKCWQNQGIECVLLRGTSRTEPADALFLHVDLTVLPDAYLKFAARYPLVINGQVRDISKRQISTHLITRADPWSGPVIVKTDRNFGGRKERGLARRNPLYRLVDSLRGQLPWVWQTHLKPSCYPIFASSQEVPAKVWRNRQLVVEKLLPEREGPHYCLRQWVFLGDREMSQRTVAGGPIVKAGNILRREQGIAIPESLRRLRRAMGFDYGKFDFVEIDGEAVLLDANRTPSFNAADPTPEQRAMLDNLAQGLPALLKDSAC